MAFGFGTTYGSASSSRIQSGFSGQNAQRTIAVTTFRQSNGPSGLGRVFDFNQVEYMSGLNTNTNLAYTRRWSTSGDSQWLISNTDTFNTTHSIVISYDTSSTSNVPIAYRNGGSVSVTLNTGNASPAGTPNTTGSEMIIGNRGDQARSFDGWIANLAIWNDIIPADIARAISNGLSPLIWRRNLVYYNPLISASQDLIQNRTQTISGTVVQTHPRIFGL